jgi:hypothetical protein
MTLALVSYSYTAGTKISYFVLIPLVSLIMLKSKCTSTDCTVVLHYLIYSTVKYKDDGRDVVTMIDFLSIHVTFPYISAWVTYQIVYTASIALCALCPDEGSSISPNDMAFCAKFQTTDVKRFYYYLTVETSKVAFVLIFVEMSIYLTYYKDIVFSFTTLVNYTGMFIVS